MKYLSSRKFVDPENYETGGGGGCFVATAAFGSMATASVEGLTSMRDDNVLSSATGTGLLELYYELSPAPARAEGRSPAFSALVREWLSELSR
ncbi:MAG: CFI-box-CTERM domain-containing protein [Planctomycetota bacterium]|nr:CFI-box-CTERM domain-containing protein [Planctomycetota bacterium]